MHDLEGPFYLAPTQVPIIWLFQAEVRPDESWEQTEKLSSWYDSSTKSGAEVNQLDSDSVTPTIYYSIRTTIDGKDTQNSLTSK